MSRCARWFGVVFQREQTHTGGAPASPPVVNQRPWNMRVTMSWMVSSASATRCSTRTHASVALGNAGDLQSEAHILSHVAY